MSSRKRTTATNDGYWSRNFRYNSYYFDSEDDAGDDSPPDHDSGLGSSDDSHRDASISEDVKLIGDLDLSSRHDEAVFKANPWSIAKVNAAVRTRQLPSDTSVTTHTNVRSSEGILADAFKKQVEKSKRNVNASSSKPGIHGRSCDSGAVSTSQTKPLAQDIPALVIQLTKKKPKEMTAISVKAISTILPAYMRNGLPPPPSETNKLKPSGGVLGEQPLSPAKHSTSHHSSGHNSLQARAFSREMGALPTPAEPRQSATLPGLVAKTRQDPVRRALRIGSCCKRLAYMRLIAVFLVCLTYSRHILQVP